MNPDRTRKGKWIFPFLIGGLMACSADLKLIDEKFEIGHHAFVDSVWVLVAINHDRYYSGEKGIHGEDLDHVERSVETYLVRPIPSATSARALTKAPI